MSNPIVPFIEVLHFEYNFSYVFRLLSCKRVIFSLWELVLLVKENGNMLNYLAEQNCFHVIILIIEY